ncbi:MAG: caspase family protein [Parcubacteria group bacterium]
MKKITVVFLAVLLFSGALSAKAKGTGNGVDFSKPLKTNDFKLEKKQVISGAERQLAEEMVKGKMGGKTKPAPIAYPSATGTLNPETVDNAKKYAVVIGLSNYAGTANDLCVTHTDGVNALCADGDSLNMQDVLLKDGYAQSNIHLFRDDATSFEAISAAVASIAAAAEPDSEITFFFSGHSATTTTLSTDPGTPHLGLALYNAPSGEIIWDEQLRGWFSGLTTQRVIFVFDTCHAGQLEPFLKGSGREVVMSSAANQYSYTYSLGGYNGLPGEGLFTHYFAKEAILAGSADGFNAARTKDQQVAVEEAFEFTKKYVSAAKHNQQIPVLNDWVTNDILF